MSWGLGLRDWAVQLGDQSSPLGPISAGGVWIFLFFLLRHGLPVLIWLASKPHSSCLIFLCIWDDTITASSQVFS